MDRTLRIGRFKNFIHVAFIFLLLISWQSVGYSDEISRSVTYSAEFKPLGDGIDWKTSIPADFDPIFLRFIFKVNPGTLTSEINGNIIFDQDNQTLSVKPRVITDQAGNSFAGKLENSAGVLLSGEVVYDITIPIPIFPDITLNGTALIPGFPHIDVGWHDEAFFNTFLLGTNESVEVKGGVRKLVSADVTAIEIAELLAIALSQGTLPQKIADKAGDILKKYIGDGGIKINGGLETRFVFSSSGIYVDGQLITRANQTVTAAGLNTALSSYSIHSSFEEALSVALDFILSSDIFFKFAPFDIELWSYEKEIAAVEIPLVPEISVNTFDFTTSPDPITFPVQAQDVTAPNQSPTAVGSITNETLQVGGSSTPIDISSKFNDPDNDTLTYNSTSSDSTVATAQIVGSQMTVYAWSAGSATITITSTDPEGLQATHTFTVTVQSSTTTVNRTPVAERTISTRSLYVDGVSTTIDVSSYFRDPDGDDLTYNATSNNTRVATVEELGGSRIRISPKGNGSATVTVTANDGSLSATQSFTVNVSTLLILGNRSPIAQGTISSQTLTAGDASTTIDVSSYFHDPDGDTLTYTVTSSDDDVLSVQRTGSSSIRLTPEDGGSATVTVTASDSRLSITQTFSVTVSPSNVESSDSSDVVVENISADYVNNYPGERYTVSVTVRNAGGRRAPGAHLRYYYSSDATYSTDDEEYENLDDDLGVLDSGETKRENVHLDAPDEQGSFYIIARVARVRNERNTRNNYAAIKITVLPPKAADLVVSLTAYHKRNIATVSQGNYLIDSNDYFQLIVLVQNIGKEDASSGATVRFYASTDATFSSDDEEIGTEYVKERQIEEGESEDEHYGLRAPEKPGKYYYFACVDSVDNERKTDNNCSNVVILNVRGPDLVIDSVSVDYYSRQPLVYPNGHFEILATVRNQGTDDSRSTYLHYYVSSDAILSDDDIEVDTADRVHSLDPGETENEQTDAIKTNYVSGFFYCFVCIDEVEDEIDTDNNCSEAIRLNIRNVAPQLQGTIAAQTLRVGEPKSVDVSQAFTDLNKDTLTYNASSSDNNVATVTAAQSQVTITPRRIGSATITVTASDSEFSATQTISISVAAQNQEPVAIGTISDRTLKVGDTSEQIDVASNFRDDDGDTLIYTATSSNRSVATVTASVSSAQVTITPVAVGSATITVTASDGSLTATQTISVSVEAANRAPVAFGIISARTLTVGATPLVIDVANNFQDHDGDNLTYNASSNNTSVATASVSNAQVTITPVAVGSATITVTASDGSLTATQTIALSITGTSSTSIIPDPNLATAVRETLGLGANDDITQTNIQRLTSLEAENRRITNLAGLEYATNLKTLVLSHNQISNVSQLSTLTNLTVLSIWDNNISDVSALSTLTNLKTLYLNGNNISDVSALAALTNLYSLALHGNNISDVSALAALTNLNELYLYNNQISDVSPLTSLTNLEILHLHDNQIAALPVGLFGDFSNLRQLFISPNPGGPFTLTLKLTRTDNTNLASPGPATVKVRVAEGAPFAMSVNLSVYGGTLSTTTAMIAKGSTESDAITVTQIGTSVTTVSLGTAPSVPSSNYKGVQPAVGDSLILFNDAGQNNSPYVVGTISAPTLFVGGSNETVDISDYFQDSDGDTLTYTVSSNNTAVADVSNSGSTVTLTPKTAGSVTVTVTASDGSQTATLEFTVDVLSSIIPDPNLAVVVRDALGLGVNDDITSVNILGLTSLRANRHSASPGAITDLTGLDSATNLTWLVLDNNAISDLSPLAALTNLSLLQLSGNDISISDVTPLQNLTKLTSLTFRNNDISDISPLASLTNLTRLSLSSNDISDISPLQKLTKLTSLGLDGNDISDISSLQKLTKLTSLSLAGNDINDISSLQNLTKLKNAYLHGNDISDVTPLKDLTNLTDFLHLYNNDISDVTPLKGLTNLKSLLISNNQISDVSPLTSLTNLTSLSLSSNAISDISSLKVLTQLQQLTVSNNQIASLPVGMFKGFSSLSNLQLDGNPGAPFTLTLELERTDNTDLSTASPATVKVKLAEGAPSAMSVSLSVTGGTLSTTTATIAKGSTESSAITVTQTGSNATTVSLGTAPSLSYNGIQTAVGDSLVLFGDASTLIAVGTIPAQTFTAGGTATTVNVSNYFSAPNGNTLTYTTTSSATSAATVSVSGSQVTITPVAAGSATITVTANDGTSTATQTISVTVLATDAPLSERTQQVRDAIVAAVPDVDSAADVTAAHLAKITSLSLSSLEITSLKAGDFDGLTSLTTLNLGSNSISDISTLAGLTSLTTLNLSANSISDISALSKLTSLTTLNLSANSISDISALSKLTSLTTLNLGSNSVSNISTLSKLTSLTELNLGSNSASDISALSGLTSLTELNLLGNSISDISALSKLTSLTELNLYGNLISDISALSKLTALTELKLGNNYTSDISALSGLTSLTTLDLHANSLYGNSISNISALSGLTSLTKLNLSFKSISDISVLSGLTSLTELHLGNTSISDISALSGLTSLTKLWLGSNSISDISALSGLTSLTTLHLYANSISDISVLSGLTSLTTLNLHSNSISDISALSGLTSLTTLYLQSNSIGSVTPLRDLTVLTNLSLRGNPITDYAPLRTLKASNTSVSIDIDLDNNIPAFTEGNSTTRTVAENTASGVNIGNAISATDADNHTLTYSLSGTDASSFSIVSTSGQLQTSAALDYETTTSYSVTVTVNDGNSGGDNISVTINVTDDVNGAPAAQTNPAKTALLSNYPNPFNPETWIPYQLAKPADVTLTIYDVRGVVVRQLALGYRAAGVYHSRPRAAHWDGRNNIDEKVATGVYFVKFTAGDYTATRKMLILK